MDVFKDYKPSEWAQIVGYGSRDAYLDADTTIGVKARDMVTHYVEHVFPNGFKAQVVANSRQAAVTYKAAIETALAEVAAELEQSNPLQVDVERLKK